jgi:hypothetical protein
MLHSLLTVPAPNRGQNPYTEGDTVWYQSGDSPRRPAIYEGTWQLPGNPVVCAAIQFTDIPPQEFGLATGFRNLTPRKEEESKGDILRESTT